MALPREDPCAVVNGAVNLESILLMDVDRVATPRMDLVTDGWNGMPKTLSVLELIQKQIKQGLATVPDH